jgi:PAS domain S-box-containing protein
MGNCGSKRVGGKKDDWEHQYLRVSKTTVDGIDLSRIFKAHLTKHHREGFRQLIIHEIGIVAFGAFLEDHRAGLSFWLNHKNLQMYFYMNDVNRAEARIAGTYQNLSGTKRRMTGHLLSLERAGEEVRQIQFTKGRNSVVNMMCLELYPRFLHSKYFAELESKHETLHNSQLQYQHLEDIQLESPLQWLMCFTDLTDHVSESVCISDPTLPDCPIVYVNKTFEEITGYKRSEILGRNCRFLQGPRTTVTTHEVIRQDIANGVDTKCKILNYRKSGEAFYNLLSMKAVKVKGQTKPRFIVAIQFDLSTERNALELFQLETLLELIPRELALVRDVSIIDDPQLRAISRASSIVSSAHLDVIAEVLREAEAEAEAEAQTETDGSNNHVAEAQSSTNSLDVPSDAGAPSCQRGSVADPKPQTIDCVVGDRDVRIVRHGAIEAGTRDHDVVLLGNKTEASVEEEEDEDNDTGDDSYTDRDNDIYSDTEIDMDTEEKVEENDDGEKCGASGDQVKDRKSEGCAKADDADGGTSATSGCSITLT